MEYNYRKLQTLYCIKMCRKDGIHANSVHMCKMLGIHSKAMAMHLVRYLDWKYVTRKRVRGVRAECYKLTKLGTHTLKLYLARYLKGTHLNLVRPPRPCDFKDNGILLPNYEKVKNEYRKANAEHKNKCRKPNRWNPDGLRTEGKPERVHEETVRRSGRVKTESNHKRRITE